MLATTLRLGSIWNWNRNWNHLLKHCTNIDFGSCCGSAYSQTRPVHFAYWRAGLKLLGNYISRNHSNVHFLALQNLWWWWGQWSRWSRVWRFWGQELPGGRVFGHERTTTNKRRWCVNNVPTTKSGSRAIIIIGKEALFLVPLYMQKFTLNCVWYSRPHHRQLDIYFSIEFSLFGSWKCELRSDNIVR